jgi:C_GCAxxG_C_C family probable redox protein
MNIRINKEHINKAKKLGHEYLLKYEHCSPATLLAVSETLGMEVSDEVFKASIGLSGWSGGCGGICGAISAFGLYFGLGKEEFGLEHDSSVIRECSYFIQEKFKETYGSYLCLDIKDKLFGKTEGIQYEEYLAECPYVVENASGWAIEAIQELAS